MNIEMYIRNWLSLFIIACSQQVAFSQSVTVNVKGEGNSVYAAQIDASRQALMQVLPQLVSVDRKVINDDVRETILSSASGYIESFQIVRESRFAERFYLDARVTVSANAIEQFSTLTRNNGGMALSGSSIFAEINREKAQSDFLNEFITRAFAGLPSAAVELQLKKIVRDPDRHGYVNLQIEGRLRPEFINAVESAVKSVACKVEAKLPDCVFKVKFFKGFQTVKTFFGGERVSEIWTTYLLPRNPPSGYSFLNFISGRDSQRPYSRVNWSYKGRVIFFDANKRLLNDVLDERFIAGLEFEYTLPIWGEPCFSEIDCNLTVSSRSFIIDLVFKPDTFGDSFNKIVSMEVSSYLNRSVGVNYNKPERIYNIVCLDLLDYLKVHQIDDSSLTSKDIVKGCQLGSYHPRERTLPIKQSYP